MPEGDGEDISKKVLGTGETDNKDMRGEKMESEVVLEMADGGWRIEYLAKGLIGGCPNHKTWRVWQRGLARCQVKQVDGGGAMVQGRRGEIRSDPDEVVQKSHKKADRRE
ncbi:hypothetical protein CVT26_011875 [Gymnopilus dilepis]|uniref:Uncharacterized protein n=1 Tax=Gymnopilus dilepis TaxID=231916 RepID=A0A409YH85_9AGAR|nr:hypothetical protein CVT26_011875 [Gymnopilus dilepis]